MQQTLFNNQSQTLMEIHREKKRLTLSEFLEQYAEENGISVEKAKELAERVLSR